MNIEIFSLFCAIPFYELFIIFSRGEISFPFFENNLINSKGRRILASNPLACVKYFSREKLRFWKLHVPNGKVYSGFTDLT